jgi:hypothetical protein
MSHASAPSAILQQALSRFEQDGAPPGGELFIASAKWQGARPGYYFGRGSKGVGYYLDDMQQQAAQDAADGEAAAPSRPAKPRDAEELLREAEEAVGDAGMEMLDAKGLRRLTLALERKVSAAASLAMTRRKRPPGCRPSTGKLPHFSYSTPAASSAPPSRSTTPTWRPA